MNTATAENQPRAIIDTNILLSAIAFDGKPAQILFLVLDEKIEAITSSVLLAELEETLVKVLHLSKDNVELILDEIRNEFSIVQPKTSIKISRDEDDNRVLEAAIEGNCDYIITGDKDLLDLGSYKLPRTKSPRFSLKSLQEAAENPTFITPPNPRKTVIASSIHPRHKMAGFSASDYKNIKILTADQFLKSVFIS